MFGWFRPQCPLDLREKFWSEYWTRWIVEKLGVERIRQARLVLPTREFFPDRYEGTAAHVEQVFRLVCGYMGLDADRIVLRFHTEKQYPGARAL